jgi:hypothetical protein
MKLPKGFSKKSLKCWHVHRFFQCWIGFLWTFRAILVFTHGKVNRSKVLVLIT